MPPTVSTCMTYEQYYHYLILVKGLLEAQGVVQKGQSLRRESIIFWAAFQKPP